MNSWRDVPGWFEGWGWFKQQVADAPHAAHFVEVGSWQGRSAAAMATCIEATEKLIRFDCVDHWKGSPYGSHPKTLQGKPEGWLRAEFERNLRSLGLWRFVNPIECASPEAAALYQDGSLDLVWIDGDHRQEAVAADVTYWWPKVKPGGYLGGHDWTNEQVKLGVCAALNVGRGAIASSGMEWWHRKPKRPSKPPSRVRMPDRLPGVQQAMPYLVRCLQAVAHDLEFSGKLTEAGRWCPPGRLGEPIHIFPVEADGGRAWLDISDFTNAFPEVGQPYLKKQALPEPGVEPLGQYLATEVDFFLGELSALRALTQKPPLLQGLACFSNIDEQNNAPLRRMLVERLKYRADVAVGLWRWSQNRPEVPPELAAEKMSPSAHWRSMARSAIAYALPGVGGDTTRLQVEALAMGACVLTVEGEQVWPGNWRGCWTTMRRDLSDVQEISERLISDDEERRRVARLGLWYFERELAPDPYGHRILAACARTSA